MSASASPPPPKRARGYPPSSSELSASIAEVTAGTRADAPPSLAELLPAVAQPFAAVLAQCSANNDKGNMNVNGNSNISTCRRFPACVAGVLARRRKLHAGLLFADLIELGALQQIQMQSQKQRQSGRSDQIVPAVPLRWLEVKVCAGESVADSALESVCSAAERIDREHFEKEASPSELVCATADDVQRLRRSVQLGSFVCVYGEVTVEENGHLLLRAARWRILLQPPDVLALPGIDRVLLNRSLHSREARVLLSIGQGIEPLPTVPLAALPASETAALKLSLCHAWAQFQRLGDALPAACGARCLDRDIAARRSQTRLVGSAFASPTAMSNSGSQAAAGLRSASNASCVVGSCGRRHFWESAREEKRWDERRLRAEQARKDATDDSDPHTDKASKLSRASCFVDWLVATFGAAYLSRGTGVLDVAGGRGAVSFELFNKRGIRTTLIEPRERKLDRSQHAFLQTQPESQRVLCPHIQTFFTPDILQRPEDNQILSLVRDCSIVVGLHSDEATEPIVDVALAVNVPFAVVPCCTFTHLHPERRTLDNQPVRTTTEFADYLQRKVRATSTPCEADYLNFRGRNKVLFSRGIPSEQEGSLA